MSSIPTLDRSELEAVVRPYVRREATAGDHEVRRILRREARFWRWRKCQRRMSRLLGNVGRTTAFVKESYETGWAGIQWDVLGPKAGRDYLMTWRDRFFWGNAWVIPRAHLAVLRRLIEHLRPRSVLEVGSGPGLNLFLLASLFPDIRFAGVELTESGVALARRTDALERLPPAAAAFAPFELNPVRPVGTIDFRQGNAMALPFPDRSFDLVFSRQALEQMRNISATVFSEIRRVSTGHAAFFEAFREWNAAGACRDRTIALDYFDTRLEDLPSMGFRVVATELDMPCKTYMSVGLALVQKT